MFDGCTTNNNTNPARLATEQLLLSAAVDNALKSANLVVFSHQKVFWIQIILTVTIRNMPWAPFAMR
jgi:hypothetical protein